MPEDGKLSTASGDDRGISMIYYARLMDFEKKVEIHKNGHTYTVIIDGQTFTADALLIDGPSSISIIIDNKCREAVITKVGKTSLVSIGGEEFEIELQDELEHRSNTSAAHDVDLDVEEIRAPMPGVIVSVEVEDGQEIQAGTPVVIVEAMKMQNELSTATGGKVRQVLVNPGDVVDSKRTLVIIDRV